MEYLIRILPKYNRLTLFKDDLFVVDHRNMKKLAILHDIYMMAKTAFIKQNITSTIAIQTKLNPM